MGHHEKETDRDPRPQDEGHDVGNQNQDRENRGVEPDEDQDRRSAEDVPDGSGTDLDEHHEPESDRFDAG
ncbi:MAG: hypothetical protein J7474_11075 [Arthrobacter sp.]|nr:hypothetical protein [Arthrobacter sp.]